MADSDEEVTNKFYCGHKDDAPMHKGKRLPIGSMVQCATTGKISQYGVKKIDPVILEHVEIKKKTDKQIIKLEAKVMMLKKKAIDKQKSYKIAINQENKTKADKLEKEFKDIVHEYKEVSNIIRSYKANPYNKSNIDEVDEVMTKKKVTVKKIDSEQKKDDRNTEKEFEKRHKARLAEMEAKAKPKPKAK